MPPVLGFFLDSWIVCDPGLLGWPAVAVVDLGFWPVLTGLLLAAACLVLGWRLGRRRERARNEEMFSRAEGQLWEAIVELREKIAQLELLIEAHETLMAVEPENRARFAAVVGHLRDDLARAQRELAEREGKDQPCRRIS